MNQSETKEILAMFTGAYPREITPEVAVLWSNVFYGDNPDLVADAAYEWVQNEAFFPTPAGLREYMRAINRRNEPVALPYSTKIADMDKAQAAFSDGYSRSRRKEGDTEEQIQEKLGQYLRRWPQGIPGVGVS